jgi:HSP20 family protein
VTQTHLSYANGNREGESLLYSDRAVLPSLTRLLGGSQARVSIFPKVIMTRSPEAIHLTALVPGVEKSELEVHVEDQDLTISGNRVLAVSQEKVLAEERFVGNFKRVIRLPERVDFDKIEAKHEDGVLEMTLPRLAQNKRTKIEIV